MAKKLTEQQRKDLESIPGWQEFVQTPQPGDRKEVFETTIDRDQADFNGTRVTKIITIITSASDIDGYQDFPEEAKNDTCQELARLHAAKVALASLKADEREKAKKILEESGACTEIEEEAIQIEQAVQQVGS